MSRPYSRRVFLGGALSGLACAGWADAPATSLRPRSRPNAVISSRSTVGAELISAARLGGRVGFSVVDVKSGLILEGHQAAAGQPPASVTKAVTALYALETLGQGHRFATRLIATGPVVNGVLKGDLVLQGGGDPTLDTDALARMAANLKEAGVREVRGRFRVWGGAVPFQRVVDPTQPEHVGYNPSLSGLNLNFNRVHFEWKRSGKDYQVTMDARSAKYRPDVSMARMEIVDRKGPVYTYTDGGNYDSWTVARRALGKGGARWLPVRKPEAYAAEVFITFARSQGIILRLGEAATEKPGGMILVTERSEPLRDVLKGMLKYSTNITAELVGIAASTKRLGRPVSLQGSAMEMSRWAQDELGMGGAKLVDHSGLGSESRLSAQAMAQALAQAHDRLPLKPILKQFPMRDANGRINKAHPLKVSAKTGTLYFVSSLAGYVTASDGRELAFAIFAANSELRDKVDTTTSERPDGARGWNRRAKNLQQKLIERWALIYGG